MKKLLPVLSLALLAGCLAPAPKSPVSWNLNVDTELTVSGVAVLPPYDDTRFVVLRPDGSVAFDSFNVFSARPGSIIRAAVAKSPEGNELLVRRLAIDCRKEGERSALVELQLRKDGKSLARSEASAPAGDGNYSKAFSAAFKSAVDKLQAEKAR